MHRPNLERSVTAVIFWLVVASVLFVGTVPASAQSGANAQGIPQRIATLEQQVTALNERLAGLSSGSAKVLRVVDANGTEVGPMIMPSTVVRKAGEFWLLLNVGPDGFTQYGAALAADNSRCDGKLYMQDLGGLLKWTSVANGIAYYASGPTELVTVVANLSLFPAGGSSCEGLSPDTPSSPQSLSEVATVDLRGFVPPFTVRYDQ